MNLDIEVWLYKKKMPNTPGDLYYAYNNFASYRNSLGTAYMHYFARDDRIADGVLIVDAPIPAIDADEITYAIVEHSQDDTNAKARCYHVTHSEIRSGSVYLYVDIDYWGTFFKDAVFNEIWVRRSDRDLSISGVYDPITLTARDVTPRKIGTFSAKNDNLSIAFVVEYELPRGGSFTAFDKCKQMFACKLNEVTNPGSLTENLPFDQILQRVGGIYAVRYEAVTIQYTRDAHVVKAFIVPSDMIESYYGDTYFTSSPNFLYSSVFGDGTIAPRMLVKPGMKVYSGAVATYIGQEQYAGTISNGIKLPRTTNAVPVRYEFWCGSNDIKVIVKCGENMRDLTSDFTVDLTNTSGEITTNEKIGNILQAGLSAASAYGSLKAGNVVGAVGLGANAVNSLSAALGNSNGQFVQGGDAAAIFFNGVGAVDSTTYYNSPYYVRAYESVLESSGELDRVKHHGVAYDCSLGTLNLYNYPNLPVIQSGTTPFIQADCRITGVCTDAIDAMQYALAQGIFLRRV